MTDNKLSADVIRSELIARGAEAELIFKEETDSTNADIKRIAGHADDKTVVLAKGQTAGRGRMGRSFYSAADNGLYLSILIKSGINADNIVLITTAASVAVSRAIELVTGIKVGIKWVNDLYLNDRKVCGILAETICDPTDGKISGVVIGVGINCGGADFPAEIKDIAGSLGDNINKNTLAAEVIFNLCEIEKMIKDKSFIKEYKERSIVLGKEIIVIGQETQNATAVDIDDDGGLVVKLESGEIRVLRTGEISVRMRN